MKTVVVCGASGYVANTFFERSNPTGSTFGRSAGEERAMPRGPTSTASPMYSAARICSSTSPAAP